MTRRDTVLALLAGATMTMPALAQDEAREGQRRAERAGAGMSQLMERFDANEDQKLTEDELPEGFWQRFKAADADGDGAVTAEELEGMAGVMGGTRQARVGGANAPLTSEQQTVAWSLQAKSVAAGLDLGAQETTKLGASYVEARRAHAESLAALAEETGGDRRAAFQRQTELRTEHSAAFSKALAEFLDEDQAKKAGEQLGLFSPAWDRQVVTLADMKLEPETLDRSVKLVGTYQHSIATARAGMRSGDRQAARATMDQWREELNKGMESLLTTEQYEAWQKSGAAPRGGRSRLERRPGRGG